MYQVSDSFPSAEKFGIIAQIRRCSVSIPSNIAEGCGRNTDNELMRFLDIALGSAFELETQLLLSQKLSFGKPEDLTPLIEELNQIQKMITGFKKSLK